MYLSINNDVGIGTTAPATRLDVNGDITDEGIKSCDTLKTDANGKINCVSSDERLKQDIQPLDASSSLDAIMALDPVSFNWKDPTNGGALQFGFLAQEAQKIFPNLVTQSNATTTWTPDGTFTFDYLGLISPIVKSIQEIASIGGTFRGSLVAWLGDTGMASKICTRM